MKTYLWLSTAAFALICFTCWALSNITLDSFVIAGAALPLLASLVLEHNFYFLFIPIPWIIYSFVLGKRRELTPNTVFAFTGTLFLATAFLGSITALALILPSLKIGEHIH